MTEPFVIERFGGLDLQHDPQEIGAAGAVDLLNVDFDRPGRVRTRDGTAQWNNSTLSSTGYSALLGTAALTGAGLVGVRYSGGGNVNVDRMDTTGTITNTGSFAGAAGTFTLSHVDANGALVASFVTQPSTAVTLKVLTGAGAPTDLTTGKPLYVGLTPVSARLVQAGFFAAGDSPTGSNGSRSTVFFSDLGSTSFSANNWVSLRPNDGEVITAVVTFGNDLWVFKQSSAFIFYGESTDADGEPIFNYRRIDLPDPLSDPVSNAPLVPYVVTGPDAVYFATANGIWRTAGGLPSAVSGAVNKIFSRDATIPSSIQNQTSNVPPSLAWVASKLVATYTTAAAAVRQLVWDPRVDAWTLWDVPGISFAQYPAGLATARDSLYYVRGSGNNNVFVMRPSSTTDSGSAITWSYSSGFYALSDPGRTAVTLESRLWGLGTVTLKVANDEGSADTGSALTLGSSPTVADAWQQIDREGTLWQHQLSGSGQAAVSRLAHYVSHVKPAGVE